MENLTPIEIANKIKELSGLDVFKNSRQRKYIEVRSLFNHLLRNKLNMRWIHIADIHIKNGKTSDHSTVLYSSNNYAYYCQHNPKLIEIENIFTFKSDLCYDKIDRVHYLENKVTNLENKNAELKNKFNHPMYKIIRDVPESLHNELGLKLKLWQKSLEWKKELN
jgi:hypothetical protein|tara:strand:+ start:7231 stop:7725 length:495 start_codon:yes stop_codon:yes gene_type:complete